MTDGTAGHSEAPGWGIDWSSWETRRRFLAIAVAFALSNSLCVIAGTAVFGSLAGPQTIGALIAGVVSVGAFTLLCGALIRWLRPLIAHGDDFGSVTKAASKADLVWSVAWISIVLMLPALITIPVFVYFELKPFLSIFAILFIGNLVIGLYPLVVIALRGPDAPPLRTPTKDNETRDAKRIETGMIVCAFMILFFLLAMTGALLVHFTSRLV